MNTSPFIRLAAWLTLSSLASLPALHAATPVTATSHIEAVTVYPDRAVVTRTATLDLPAGLSEVSFNDLPARLQEASLQANARGSAPLTLLDVASRLVVLEAEASPRVRAAEEELATLRREDRVLTDRTRLLDQQRALLGRIETAATTPPSGDPSPPSPSFEDWTRLLTFQADTLARFDDQRRTLDHERETLAAKITAAEARLAQLRREAPGRRQVRAATLRLHTESPSRAEVTLTYTLPQASWSASYDARLQTTQRTLALSYAGIVRNQTGEDWNEVRLTLSTARPSLGGAATTPAPRFLDVFQPLPPPSPVSRPRAGSGAVNAYSDTSSSLMMAPATMALREQAVIPVAAVEAGATSATFQIADRVSLPSDGTTRKVPILAVSLEPRLSFQITPALAETAYLEAALVNSTDAPFLAGELRTYLDNTYVATGSLKTVMPGESFDLSLGADEGIAVSRRLVNRFTETTGLGSRTRRTTYDFLLTFTNHKTATESLVFKEALPLSRDERITVRLQAPTERSVGTPDRPAEVTREADNLLVWRLSLAPGEKREIPFRYTVEHPNDLEIVGLE